MGCIGKTVLFLVLLGAVAGGVSAIWLPWYGALLIGLSPILLVVILILGIGFALGGLGQGIKSVVGPKQKTRKLKAGETFESAAFTFTAPVRCKVQHMAGMDMEFIGIVPELEGAPKPAGTMVAAANCISIADLKKRLEPVFAKVAELPAEARASVEQWEPAEELGMRGEAREFRVTKDGELLRVRTVFVGEGEATLAWLVGAPEAAFEATQARVREIAGAIRRRPVNAAPASQ